jgi:hypothetical protein
MFNEEVTNVLRIILVFKMSTDQPKLNTVTTFSLTANGPSGTVPIDFMTSDPNMTKTMSNIFGMIPTMWAELSADPNFPKFDQKIEFFTSIKEETPDDQPK